MVLLLGLWKYSAHPNYASEQGMWIVFYLFSVAACGYHQFTFIGGLNLVFLFSPSVDLSEGITREKYSHYSTYLLETPRFASIYVLGPLFAFIAASPYLIWLHCCYFLYILIVPSTFDKKYIFRNSGWLWIVFVPFENNDYLTYLKVHSLTTT